MRFRDEFVILGVAAGLALAVYLVVAITIRREPGEPFVRASAITHQEEQVPESDEDPDPLFGDAQADPRARAASADDDDVGPLVASARRKEARKREAAGLAEFTTLGAEQGLEALEQSARAVLAARGEPHARRMAAMRALHAAGAAGIDAVLASVVEHEPDVQDRGSVSLPRCALKLLFERAPSDADARRALARLAFVQETKVTADLRRAASTALSASFAGAGKDAVAELLRLEAKPEELERALEALAGDTNFGADRPVSTTLGAARPASRASNP